MDEPDEARREEISKRWARVLNRDMDDPSYRDEWYSAQCGACRHWIALKAPLGADFGACANPRSPFDQRVTFEHDGCAAFEPGADWYD